MISLIWCQGQNGEIGKDNKLLWKLPNDMKRFKELTTGKTVVMGRKTFESIGKPLPDRRNVVISRNYEYDPNVERFNDPVEACKLLYLNSNIDEIFIIGGSQIYEQTIGIADRLYVTFVHANFPDADAFAPRIDKKLWNLEQKIQKFKSDEKHAFDYQFELWNRRSNL